MFPRPRIIRVEYDDGAYDVIALVNFVLEPFELAFVMDGGKESFCRFRLERTQPENLDLLRTGRTPEQTKVLNDLCERLDIDDEARKRLTGTLW